MKRDNLAALSFVLAGLLVLVISLYAKTEMLLPRSLARPLGVSVFFLGMLLFLWALVHLRESFLGEVEPVSDRLVTGGPYAFIRHPVYLGMLVATVGLAIGLRSLWGVIAVCLLFLPAAVYRARLEEKAMAHRFGKGWDEYVERTHFMLPRVY